MFGILLLFCYLRHHNISSSHKRSDIFLINIFPTYKCYCCFKKIVEKTINVNKYIMVNGVLLFIKKDANTFEKNINTNTMVFLTSSVLHLKQGCKAKE